MAIAAAIISAVAGLAAGGAAIAQTSKKPPKVNAPAAAKPLAQITPEDRTRVGTLPGVATSALGVTDTATTGRNKLLGN